MGSSVSRVNIGTKESYTAGENVAYLVGTHLLFWDQVRVALTCRLFQGVIERVISEDVPRMEKGLYYGTLRFVTHHPLPFNTHDTAEKECCGSSDAQYYNYAMSVYTGKLRGLDTDLQQRMLKFLEGVSYYIMNSDHDHNRLKWSTLHASRLARFFTCLTKQICCASATDITLIGHCFIRIIYRLHHRIPQLAATLAIFAGYSRGETAHLIGTVISPPFAMTPVRPAELKKFYKTMLAKTTNDDGHRCIEILYHRLDRHIYDGNLPVETYNLLNYIVNV